MKLIIFESNPVDLPFLYFSQDFPDCFLRKITFPA